MERSLTLLLLLFIVCLITLHGLMGVWSVMWCIEKKVCCVLCVVEKKRCVLYSEVLRGCVCCTVTCCVDVCVVQ